MRIALLLALALAYGQDVVYSGPVYKAATCEGSTMRIAFDHVDGGLVAKGGPLQRFSICGPDKRFVWAPARIDGDTVLVWHDDVPEPVAVRYGWEMNPDLANLYNQAGLPASCFRTDDWPSLPDHHLSRLLDRARNQR